MNWISVFEQLPQEPNQNSLSTRVLVSRKNRPVIVAFFSGGNFWEHENRRIFPTHWMPLPNAV